ncbi:MAG: hypothetical protein KA740_10795 [Rhodoferax sp.]|jgi:hypothetical protein|nr:hypothetical protein [Rhodoferax sp.]
MSTRDVNLYGCFEDWFLANIDADSAHELRRHGASCGIGGLCYYSETVELFNAFGNEIERLATDDYDVDLWQIAKASDARGITELKNSLVWIAAERLAHQLKFQLAEQQEESDDDLVFEEGDVNEN